MSKINNASASLKTANFSKWVIFVFFGLILSASIRCANIQQPTGGPRDTIPPVLISESPRNLSTNFTAKKVVISFDEFIKLNNAQKEISISPAMDQLPLFKVKRRSLEMELPDSLAENTTYVINFGEAIADNNEGNPIKDYRYVFSTGNEIDSLQIKGQVINAYTNEPEYGITVLLIPTSQDSIFGKKKANIFATTDSSGNFALRYLREDQYNIYALKETNNDRIYNSPEEWLGFLQDTIALKRDTSDIKLWMSKPIPKELRVMDRQITSSGMVYYTFNKPLIDPSIEITFPKELDETKIVEVNQTKDSIFMWLSDMTFDSLKVNIIDQDSIRDSVLIRRPKNDKYAENITLTNNLDKNKVNKIQHLNLFANAPIKEINRNKISFLEDSTKITNYLINQDSINNKKLHIRANWKPKRTYNLTFEKDAVIDYFGRGNDITKLTFTLEENEKFGDILLKLTTPDSISEYLVELVDEKKTQIIKSQSVKQSGEISYKNVPEGKYLLRIIYDENKNGKWDPGDVESKQQPERMWYYDKTFIIRPNWEQTENINIPANTTTRQRLRPSKKP